jgi:formylmethanofuran dehydrogenase subunit B
MLEQLTNIDIERLPKPPTCDITTNGCITTTALEGTTIAIDGIKIMFVEVEKPLI